MMSDIYRYISIILKIDSTEFFVFFSVFFGSDFPFFSQKLFSVFTRTFEFKIIRTQKEASVIINKYITYITEYTGDPGCHSNTPNYN